MSAHEKLNASVRNVGYYGRIRYEQGDLFLFWQNCIK